jgi:AcrR family transcriptional regulator
MSAQPDDDPSDDSDTASPAGTLERITAAARRLFATHGVAATRMEDVARESGISRQYLYRLVPNRHQLVEHALVARCWELGAILQSRAQLDTSTIEDALLDQIIAGVTLGRDDSEFVYLANAVDRVRLHVLLTSADSPLHEINTGVYGRLFARAVAEGRLRTDMSLDSMVEWLQGVMTMLASRDDQDLDAMRAMVRGYVLPSLLKG